MRAPPLRSLGRNLHVCHNVPISFLSAYTYFSEANILSACSTIVVDFAYPARVWPPKFNGIPWFFISLLIFAGTRLQYCRFDVPLYFCGLMPLSVNILPLVWWRKWAVNTTVDLVEKFGGQAHLMAVSDRILHTRNVLNSDVSVIIVRATNIYESFDSFWVSTFSLYC